MEFTKLWYKVVMIRAQTKGKKSGLRVQVWILLLRGSMTWDKLLFSFVFMCMLDILVNVRYFS